MDKIDSIILKALNQIELTESETESLHALGKVEVQARMKALRDTSASSGKWQPESGTGRQGYIDNKIGRF